MGDFRKSSHTLAAYFLRNRLTGFFGVMVVFALLNAILESPFVVIPPSAALAADILVSVVFLAVPLLALYIAAGYAWTSRLAVLFVVVGASLHVIGVFGPSQGLLALAMPFVKSLGLIGWCLGLGALLGTQLKEKNLLVPVAIFLALLDTFLVLTPIGFTHQELTQQKAASKGALYEIPKPRTAPVAKGQPVAPLRALFQIGPADFFFLSALFVVLFRFGLRPNRTLLWVLPILAAYLLVVMLFDKPPPASLAMLLCLEALCAGLIILGIRLKSTVLLVIPSLAAYLVAVVLLGKLGIGPNSLGAMPALVPIGITALLVNREEFDLNREEKFSTALIAALMVVIIAIGMAFWPRVLKGTPSTRSIDMHSSTPRK
jgi:hypothetical protein